MLKSYYFDVTYNLIFPRFKYCHVLQIQAIKHHHYPGYLIPQFLSVPCLIIITSVGVFSVQWLSSSFVFSSSSLGKNLPSQPASPAFGSSFSTFTHCDNNRQLISNWGFLALCYCQTVTKTFIVPISLAECQKYAQDDKF